MPQLGLIHYLSAGYLLLALGLTLTRKYKQRFIAMLPPICQVASVLVLKALGFQPILLVLFFLLNLALVIWVDITERKLMGTEAPEFAEREEKEIVSLPKQNSGFVVDTDLLGSAPLEKATDSTGPELFEPERENKPINEVAPVQQEIFDASKSEIEEMIESMVSAGDIENAKRYLRMLAFFAKDDSSRKIAEKKLAEINKMA